MPIYVKDGGTWREISSNAGSQLYVRDATSFTNKTITNAYIKDGGSWRTAFTLFDTPTSFSTATGAVGVPANANAIHVQFAVGGGSGGVGGGEYDKAGAESAGAGGASGGYISDKVFSVTGGETLTISAGTAGSGTSTGYTLTAGSGGATSITGSASTAIFSLAGGVGGSSTTTGGDQGPPRSNFPSTGGAATISGTVLTSGTTVDGLNITTFTSGPVGTFNSDGSGNAGTNPGNCVGDNCQITGGVGGQSYAGPGAVSGGSGGPAGGSSSAGSRGSGGGGGGSQPSVAGSAGGAGEISYRFLRIV
tara:strand:+ start:17 stop:934 length:918 start_codon:yes stop_codon:yes gene_type:complete